MIKHQHPKQKKDSRNWLLFFLFFLMASSINAQISGTVFRDFNGNGIQGTSAPNLEPGVAGVIVNAVSYTHLDVYKRQALDQDVEKAKRIAFDAVLNNKNVLNSPSPEINVLKVGDGMCTLAIRPYTKQENYWDVYFGVQEILKLAFEKNGISGPTPTRIIINK